MSIHARARLAAAVILVLVFPTAGHTADLQPATVEAFNRYVRLTEARMNTAAPFLWIDTLPAAERRERLDALRRKEVVIERLTTRDGRAAIDVPDGLIHHWNGLVFIRGAALDRVVALLQDYDAHSEIYAPVVARSKLRSRQGDTFRVYLRFVMTKVITVVVNSEHEARFRRVGADRIESAIRSTRIAEVTDPGTSKEQEKPVGHDGGYLWRLNTYWRFLERDGGTYVQCESISLTRGIPTGFGWLVGPFVTSIPRDSLTFTLEQTRARLER